MLLRSRSQGRLLSGAAISHHPNAAFGDLLRHRPARDHRLRLDTEDNPPWVHPYKTDPSQLDELRRQLDKLHRSGRI